MARRKKGMRNNIDFGVIFFLLEHSVRGKKSWSWLIFTGRPRDSLLIFGPEKVLSCTLRSEKVFLAKRRANPIKGTRTQDFLMPPRTRISLKFSGESGAMSRQIQIANDFILEPASSCINDINQSMFSFDNFSLLSRGGPRWQQNSQATIIFEMEINMLHLNDSKAPTIRIIWDLNASTNSKSNNEDWLERLFGKSPGRKMFATVCSASTWTSERRSA